MKINYTAQRRTKSEERRALNGVSASNMTAMIINLVVREICARLRVFSALFEVFRMLSRKTLGTESRALICTHFTRSFATHSSGTSLLIETAKESAYYAVVWRLCTADNYYHLDVRKQPCSATQNGIIICQTDHGARSAEKGWLIWLKSSPLVLAGISSPRGKYMHGSYHGDYPICDRVGRLAMDQPHCLWTTPLVTVDW